MKYENLEFRDALKAKNNAAIAIKETAANAIQGMRARQTGLWVSTSAVAIVVKVLPDVVVGADSDSRANPRS